MREFRAINNIKYNAKVNTLLIEYIESDNRQRNTMLFLEGAPGEIDFGTGMVPESIRIRIKTGDTYVKGKVGERIAANIAKKKLNAIILDEVKKLTKADREIIIDGDFGIIEAKLATDKKYLRSNLIDATKQIHGRFAKCAKYKKGVAFSIYANEDTGDFEYVYKVVTPEKDKALPRRRTKKRGEEL